MRLRRYEAIGRCYDLVSLEPLLYRNPRQRLLQLLAPAAGTTVLDIGCGTGLNFPNVLRAIGPGGQLIGVDSSRSMLAQANRRVARRGWSNVHLVKGETADLLDILDRMGIARTGIDIVLATFVLSVLEDDQPIWNAIDRLAACRPLRVGIADIGPATSAIPPMRLVYRLLAALGGADPNLRPWDMLGQRGALNAHEEYRGGHIHIATADYRSRRSSH